MTFNSLSEVNTRGLSWVLQSRKRTSPASSASMRISRARKLTTAASPLGSVVLQTGPRRQQIEKQRLCYACVVQGNHFDSGTSGGRWLFGSSHWGEYVGRS